MIQQFSLIFQKMVSDNWKFFGTQKFNRKSDTREFYSQNLISSNTKQKLDILIKKWILNFQKLQMK